MTDSVRYSIAYALPYSSVLVSNSWHSVGSLSPGTNHICISTNFSSVVYSEVISAVTISYTAIEVSLSNQQLHNYANSVPLGFSCTHE
jgi:hypothetical protein